MSWPRLPVKKFLPRSLLGRSLLIVLLPLVLLQAVALQIFYGSHLDIVSRRFSFAVAGEIAYTLDLIRAFRGRTIKHGFSAKLGTSSRSR